jgi:hypothetical protein
MTGAVLVTAGCGGGGGGGNHPHALAWNNPYGFTLASTQTLMIAGIGSGTAPIAATNSGGAVLSSILNGTSGLYTGAFTVRDGDMLGWSLLNVTSSTETGTIVVSSGSFEVGAFTYVVRGSNDF